MQYVKDQGYAGWMVWSLDTDDFKGDFCGQGDYPLIRTMNGEDVPDIKPPGTTDPPPTGGPTNPPPGIV